MPVVRIEKSDRVATIILSRPEVRNAIDLATATALADAFRDFEQDAGLLVAVLCGEGDFSTGADLKAIAAGTPNRLAPDGDAPLGPTRMLLAKPVIAAIGGYAVAGGLELAIWCDLRVAEEDAVLGFLNRRFGVPLIDGGTVRLPHLIGLGRALDLILTGRTISAAEALSIGLVDRVVPRGNARATAEALAREIAQRPQLALQHDRMSAYAGLGMPLEAALQQEFAAAGETLRDPGMVERVRGFGTK